MKLLYTITAYPPSIGGAQLYAHMLAQNLKISHDIQVISQWNSNRTDWLLGTTINAPRRDQDYVIDDIAVHNFGLSMRDKLCMLPFLPIYYPFMEYSLSKIVPRITKHLAPYLGSIDVVHNVRIGREGLTYASFYAAKRMDIPFIFTPIHHPRWVGWRYKAYLNIYRAADRIIALTNSEKETLISLGVFEEKIAVTGMGPVLSSEAHPMNFREKYNIKGPMVLFLGQHYPYKGFKQVLDSAKIVWQKRPDIEFVFVGPAIGKSEKYYSDYCDDQRIHRLGYVGLQEKTDALAACAVLCVPSTQESFGAVYVEAWNFSKPVIGCDIPAVSEIINDGENGFLVKQNARQIAFRILELILNPQQAAQMGACGNNKLKSRFSWEKLATLTEQIYDDVMSK